VSAFSRAFTLIKMPIDWDTVTEPVWTDKPSDKPPHFMEAKDHRGQAQRNSRDLQSGEASAQWIHPHTGERYNIRMDKWLRNTLNPPKNKPAWEPYRREGGEMSVTQPMSEEQLAEAARSNEIDIDEIKESIHGQDRHVGGADFYNHTDPFGRRYHTRADTAQTQDPRSTPMPDLPNRLQGLGLGTDMYDLLTHWGVPLKPDSAQSDKARRLWARNQGFDRETADMMAVERNYSAKPYEGILQQAVAKVREAGLHNSLTYDITEPTTVVGNLNIWDALGYPEATEIKEWMDAMVEVEGLKPFNEMPPYLDEPKGMGSEDQYDRYDRLKENWTWRGHNERN